MKRILAALAALCLLVGLAPAQRVQVPAASSQSVQLIDLPSLPAGSTWASLTLDGGLTDSSSTVDLPDVPRGATFATLTLEHRARFYFGTETDFVLYEGSGWCEYDVASTITQGIAMSSGGVQLGDSARAAASFARAGQCLAFDGVYDWTGASGWNSGYVWRPNTLTVTVPVARLGDTLTVRTRARSHSTVSISCHLTTVPSDMVGRLVWLNQSWWEGELDVAFR